MVLLGERTFCFNPDLNLEEYKLDLLQIHYNFEESPSETIDNIVECAQLADGERETKPHGIN